MKKIIIGASTLVIVFALTLGYVTYNKVTSNALLLANLEALTDPENSGGDGNENSSLCPDHNYAPNGVIKAETYTTSVTADSNGNINVYGKVEGGYKKYKNYSVTYEVKNCNEWAGGCCDQRQVGVKIVSAH